MNTIRTIRHNLNMTQAEFAYIPTLSDKHSIFGRTTAA